MKLTLAAIVLLSITAVAAAVPVQDAQSEQVVKRTSDKEGFISPYSGVFRRDLPETSDRFIAPGKFVYRSEENAERRDLPETSDRFIAPGKFVYRSEEGAERRDLPETSDRFIAPGKFVYRSEEGAERRDLPETIDRFIAPGKFVYRSEEGADDSAERRDVPSGTIDRFIAPGKFVYRSEEGADDSAERRDVPSGTIDRFIAPGKFVYRRSAVLADQKQGWFQNKAFVFRRAADGLFGGNTHTTTRDNKGLTSKVSQGYVDSRNKVFKK